MAANALMKRGKRTVAVSVRDESLRNTTHPQLTELLNYLLDPQQSIDNFEHIDWLRWLLSGGTTFDDFAKTVKKYDNAVTCGLVWTQDFVAYRCRTCGVSPTMSLCADCFQSSNHAGHDFNMFRSHAGGACDCGDVTVMKQQGFCARHGPKQGKLAQPPAELLSVARFMMPRLVYRFLQHAREVFTPDMYGTFQQGLNEAEQYLNFLHQLRDMGAAMRDVIADVVTDCDVYTTLTTLAENASVSSIRNAANYKVALESLTTPSVPDEFSDVEYINAPLVHNTLLQELLFWTVKLEFPATLVTFLLSLLPNNQYKESFTGAFVQHYSRICCSLVHSTDRSKTANRVVHVSVQLLSPEDLATKMVAKYRLLHIMCTCLRHIIEGCLTTCGLQQCTHSSALVVDCSRDVLKEHCYFPIASDLITILSHKAVTKTLLENETLLLFWFELLAYFQGMNVNSRELHHHVEFEPDHYYAAFTAESEICASTMWSILAHCKTQESRDYTHGVILVITKVLKDWLDSLGVTPFSKPQPLKGSFHIPLHRQLANFVSVAVTHHGSVLSDLLPAPDVLQMIMMHPLQLLVTYHEIFAGMWVRNGLQIRGQAMTYVQCHFCNSMIDSDIYLIQLCASMLDPDFFVKTVLERFHVLELMTFSTDKASSKFRFIETDKQISMLEAALTVLTLVIALRNHLGLNERGLTRLEMVTLLCTADRTHSQLKELLPEKCGVCQHGSPEFDPILKETAHFKAPVFELGGTMQQGMYSPTDSVWEHDYDPLFVLLRSMYKKDFQNSMDRFTNYVKHKGLYKESDSPWPPFRMPAPVLPQYERMGRVLHCRTMHALLFTLLYKCVHDKTMSDAVAYFSVYLLELVLSTPNPKTHNQTHKSSISEPRRDKDLSNWYSSDVIDVNLRDIIDHVSVTVSCIDDDVTQERSKRSRGGEQEMEGLFELAPSAVSASQGHMSNSWGNTSSEVINAVQALLEETVTAEGGTNNNVSPTPRVRSMGVSTSVESHFKTVNVKVGESMLTLLWKLHEKLSTHRSVYKPPAIGGGVEQPQMDVSFETDSKTGQSDSISTCDRSKTADVRVKTPRTVPGVGGNSSKSFYKGSKSSTPQNRSAPGTSTQHTGASANTSGLKSGVRSAKESRIGNGAFFIGKLLDKICYNCGENRAILQAMHTAAVQTQSSTSHDKTNTMDARRRKARERQQKLMADFAQKRKQFMEKNKDEMDVDTDDVADGSTGFESAKLDNLYDCVICNVATPSTDENPIGLVGLLQATSVLAHRSRQRYARVLPVNDKTPKQNYVTFGSEWSSYINALLDNFNETSCLMSVNIGWQGGIHVTSCGHYVHLSCHRAYVESLKDDGQHAHILRASSGEFWCPLCRQLSNTTLPIIPEVGPALMEPIPSGDRLMVQWITHYLNRRPATPCSSALTSAMSNLMEDLTKATDQKYKTCGKTPSVESVILFICSVLRCNLETEILQQQLTTVHGSPSFTGAKTCILPLLHVLGMHSKILSTSHYTELWKLVVGNWAHDDQPSDSVTLKQKEVPLLLRDSIALLLQFVLTMPATLEQEVYLCLVQALYNMCHVQALVKVSLEFSEEERTAWRSKVTVDKHTSQKCENGLEGLLSRVILYLSSSNVYEDDSASDPFVPAICGRIWSPQSVESELQAHCLPYLRMASHLMHHLYDMPLPHTHTMDQSEEFKVLCSCVDLSPRVTTQRNSDLLLSSASCVKWLCDNPEAHVKAWCTHLVEFTTKAQSTARMLLSVKPEWHCPQLLKLPKQYDQIFQYYRRKPCQSCNSLPKDPAICLVCGALICSKERCCYTLGKYECVQHSIDCGGGVGVYLLVLSSYIVLIRGPRASVWGSVYLDQHGEEDRDLKRGKPLYLSAERYKVLHHQWLSHSFDKICKRWILHRDQL